MVWYFIGVYIINRTLHGRLEIRNFSSHVENNISLVRCTHSRNIFQHSKRNFVSPRGNVISSIYFWTTHTSLFLYITYTLKSWVMYYSVQLLYCSHWWFQASAIRLQEQVGSCKSFVCLNFCIIFVSAVK